MKCYVCGKKVSTAMRILMPPKDRRYKETYRDVCDDCYEKHMRRCGYYLDHDGIWKKEV